MSKKQFASAKSIKDQQVAVVNFPNVNEFVLPPLQQAVSFRGLAAGSVQANFSPFYGQGFDDIVYVCQEQLEAFAASAATTQQVSLSMNTVVSYYTVGLRNFFRFLALPHKLLDRVLTRDDITPELIENYIDYLKQFGIGMTTQKVRFTTTKSVLKGLQQSGTIPASNQLFPTNPYPNSHRQYKGQPPLSRGERMRLVLALKPELQRLIDGEGPMSSAELSIMLLGISLRTGLNTTPLLELPIDCIEPHPFKENRSLLVSYKRRGNATHIQSLRASSELPRIKTVMPDVAEMIATVKSRQHSLRKNNDALFAYQSSGSANAGQLTTLGSTLLGYNLRAFVERLALKNDDGGPLQLNVGRLRKTFVNRLWELSGGNLWITAKHSGHSMKVSDLHYLVAPKEAKTNFRWLGEIRVKQLQTSNVVVLPASNTPVAQCKDPLNGQRAPKNGEYCTDFLGCFRCRSFVVTEDDLYRLYSLYWLLVRERERVGVSHWSKHYQHIIRIIDTKVKPEFDVAKVEAVREKARVTPHPFWQSHEQLMAGGIS